MVQDVQVDYIVNGLAALQEVFAHERGGRGAIGVVAGRGARRRRANAGRGNGYDDRWSVVGGGRAR